MVEPLVSTDWLATHLDDPDVQVVDCRWYLRPFDDRDGHAEYAAGHVPGAVHVTWDTDLADPARPGLSMLAGPDDFAATMGRVGIGDDTMVVTYDDQHVPVAARVWWALRVYGHDRVAVLDGGITRWKAEGRPLSTDVPRVEPRSFTARFQADRYATKADVLAAVSAGRTRLVDARMDVAFDAASGHIPGMVRLTGLGFLADGVSWMTPEQCRARIEEAGVADAASTITYCGGGVAATGTALAYELAGLGPVRVYDGSWTEWQADPDTPKEPHG